jgi:hypothetical protein
MSREHADIARRAAEIVQTKGLCKGFLFDHEGRVCMWGALQEASVELHGNLRPLYGTHGFNTDNAIVRNVIAAALGESAVRNLFPGAEKFNDLPETDEKDVAKFLMSVADDLELA